MEANSCEHKGKDGKCKRQGFCHDCNPSTRKWLEAVAKIDGKYIRTDEMCKKSSPFGSVCIGLNTSDINQILMGKVLHIDGEYDVFIGVLEDKELVVCNCSPCYDCWFRKMLAIGFDRHVWGDDCPKLGDKTVCKLSKDDLRGDTDGRPHHVNE